MDFRIISIGALSHHELWEETAATRTAHATCTLIRSHDRVIVVDPGLPAVALAPRLKERSGLSPDKVTDVFVTNFRPAHRRGVDAFPNARWLIAETERETVGRMLVERFQQESEEPARRLLQEEIALLRRFQNAPDQLAPHVDLFPLPGYTPGNCGLVLSHPTYTAVIASDAVATVEHLEFGRVLPGCYDLQAAQESFREAIEIADIIVPGHDNIILNATRPRSA